MKFSKLLFFITLFLIAINVSYSQSKREIKYQETKKLIEAKRFIFEGHSLTTRQGSIININGEGFMMEENKITVNLPFIGSVNKSFIGEPSTIEFTRETKNPEIKYNNKRKRIEIKFEESYKGEGYFFHIIVFGNKNAEIKISNSSRSAMTYKGVIRKI